MYKVMSGKILTFVIIFNIGVILALCVTAA